MTDFWYRYEDVQYAAPLDEFERPDGIGQLTVELRKFEVISHTPKGLWLRVFNGDKRFVLIGARKKFACPTLALAKESFIARKMRQASIYLARANQAKRAIAVIKAFPPFAEQ
jgi:hypothetical protein